RYHCRTGANGFIGPVPVYTGVAFFLFLEHLGATGTATEAVFSTAFHFYQFGVECFKHLARCLEDAVRPSEVTTVVVCDLLALERSAVLEFYPSIINQLLQKGAVMQDFIMAPQFGIFILQDVKAMRARRDDFFDVVIIQC